MYDLMVMIVHQAVGQYHGIKPLGRLRDHGQEGAAILVILEDGFAPVTT